MAPEQAGDAHQVDIRADIYSLGCTLYKLLSGRAPSRGLAPFSPQQVLPPSPTSLAKKVPDPFAPIRQLRPEIPDALAAVLDRMLAKEPADRFATPAEVAEALEPFSTTSDLASLLTESPPHPVTPSPRHLPTRHAPPATRHPLRLALAAGAAAGAILLGIVFTVSTGTGTVKLEFADAEAGRQCKISIDGDAIRIENLGEPIKLRPGKHQLRILHGDLEIETREFDVVRRGTQVLHVSIPDGIARRQSAEGRAEEAIAYFQKLVEDFPNTAEYRKGLANAYYGRGVRAFTDRDFERALSDLDQAIRWDPNNATAYDQRAHIYLFVKGDLEKAFADADKCVRLDPTMSYAYEKRAIVYALRGEYDKAIPDYNENLRLNPEHAHGYQWRAGAYMGKGDVERGIADLSTAIELGREDANLWYQRALARLGQERIEEYRIECVELLRQFGQTQIPDNAYWTAWTCALTPDAVRDSRKVVALAESAAKSNPKSVEYTRALGAARYRAGRFDEAIERLTETDRLVAKPSERLPSSPAYTWFFLAMAHHRLDHHDEANKWLDKAIAWTDKALREHDSRTGPHLAWDRLLTLKLLRAEAAKTLGKG